jgi:hypothetical protein
MKRRIRLVDPTGLASELASLPALSRQRLTERWRALYGIEPPTKIGRPILIQAIAYRMQEQALGGLRPRSRRALARAFEEIASGQPASQVPVRTRLRPGTRLLREWQGTAYEAIVLDNGVLFGGERYHSLSEVARAITGSRWSGPHFFGLKSARQNSSP